MATSNTIRILSAEFPDDIRIVEALFTAYAESLDLDLSYQQFASELSTLPGKYSQSKGGGLLLAQHLGSDNTLGCVALRAIEPASSCEMKRLYVTPEGRGLGAGRLLVEEVLHCAKSLGYAEIKLDTLPSMAAARVLYKRFGFREIPAYYDTPIKETIFLGLSLE